jgi:DNA invertase Pin-like site-specific DNA recombinase
VRIGYRRVSTLDQSTARQLDGVPLDKIFEDHLSGKDTQRPQLQAALEWAREGDWLIVHSIDRLARNFVQLRQIIDEQTKKGVTVQFIKENLILTGNDSSTSKLILGFFGLVAECERDWIRERQREGVALAKAKGIYKGRSPAIRTGNGKLAELQNLIANRTPVAEMARQLGVSRQTIYSALKQSQEVAA